MDAWGGFGRLVARQQGNIGWTAAAQVVRDIDGPAVPTGCGGGRWRVLQRNPKARIPRSAPCIGHRKRRQGRRHTHSTPYVGRVSVRVFAVFGRVAAVCRCTTGAALRGQGHDNWRVSVRHTLAPTKARRPKAAEVGEGHAERAHAPPLQPAAWGVEPKAAPGGQDGRICGMSDGEIDAGEAGGGEPSRRLSGGRCGRSRRQSCAARCRRRGRKMSRTRAGTSARARCAARCAAKLGTERPHGVQRAPSGGDARSRRSRPGRARRRSATSAVRNASARRTRRWSQAMPSNAAPTVSGTSARGGERSEFSGQAERAASEASGGDEGLQPEGARPRSGDWSRKARPRSDVAQIVCMDTPHPYPSLGTIVTNTVFTVVSIGVSEASSLEQRHGGISHRRLRLSAWSPTRAAHRRRARRGGEHGSWHDAGCG